MVNYFELFGLPVSFHPDAATVKKKFYEVRRYFNSNITVSENQKKIFSENLEYIKRAEITELLKARLNNSILK